MRFWTLVVIALLSTAAIAVAAVPLPRPPAGKATIGGTWTQLGRTAQGEEVSLYRKRAGKAPKLVAEVKTGARGSYVFRAVAPGSYQLSIGLSVESAKIEGKRCGVRDFEIGLSIQGTDDSGVTYTIMSADTKFFRVKAGDRITKNIVFACT
jgi:hypothetical protein